MQTYAVFLRGININGHNKMPMAELRSALEMAGFTNVKTVLASGNVLLDSNQSIEVTQEVVSDAIEKTFGFKVAIITRTLKYLQQLIDSSPFKELADDKDLKPNITFLQESINTSGDELLMEPGEFKVVAATNTEILSIVYMDGKKRTLGLMKALKEQHGKNITTRTWKTVVKLALLSGS
jgi:uncharacterized protein (DUF1697 family)